MGELQLRAFQAAGGTGSETEQHADMLPCVYAGLQSSLSKHWFRNSIQRCMCVLCSREIISQRWTAFGRNCGNELAQFNPANGCQTRSQCVRCSAEFTHWRARAVYWEIALHWIYSMYIMYIIYYVVVIEPTTYSLRTVINLIDRYKYLNTFSLILFRCFLYYYFEYYTR